ncbi:MAG: universal stress protein [Candidatus Sericytochromatia bacterium]
MKILLTTDGSPCSRHALEEASRLLPLKEAEVALLAVAQLPPVGTDPMTFGAPLPVDDRALNTYKEQALNALQEGLAILASAGVKAESMETLGDPATEILSVAEQMGADMIVVGSHGRNAVERLFLGSVSDAIAHRFRGAVMVIRPKE